MRGSQHHAAGHVRDLSFCLKDSSEIELIENGLYYFMYWFSASTQHSREGFSRFILYERWNRRCNFENLVYIDQLCIHETPNISLQRKNSILFVLKNWEKNVCYLKNFDHKTIFNYYAVMADQRHTGFHNRALMRGSQHHAAGHVRDLSFCLKDPILAKFLV
jgi:hypothetical protein